MAESGTQALAERARHAAGDHEWHTAFEAFAAANDLGVLTADDLVLYATAGYLIGNVAAAVDALGQCYRLSLDAGRPTVAVRAGGWAVYMLTSHGAGAQAAGWLARCQAILDGLDEDDPAHTFIRCFDAFRTVAMEHEYAAGHEKASHVIACARRDGDHDLLALGLNIDGRALVRSGHLDDGMRRLDEAMVEVLSGLLSPVVSGTVYCSVIEACEEIGEIQRAQEWTETLSRWCESQGGMLTFNGQCLTHRASILRFRGRWNEAEVEANQAMEKFAGAADQPATGRAWYERAEIHRLRGENDRAETAYKEASQWGHDPQPGLSLLRVAQGNVPAAMAALRRGLAESRDDPLERLRLLPALVDVLVLTGDVEGAADAAAELAGLAGTFRTDALAARSAFANAAVHLARGEPAPAMVGLRRAIALWRALHAPYEEARTRTLIATACRAMGDDETAALEAAAAQETFARLGAVTTPSTGAVRESRLSPRELEVLALVATGMTNQHIADELFLAVKTIERHVGHILMKLGVSSRTAAAAYAYEHHLL